MVLLAALTAGALSAAAAVPSTSHAWSVDFCGYYVGANGSCGEGSYRYLTYVSGSTDITWPPGLCVYAITAANNVRGSNTYSCTSGNRFTNICYRNESPASMGRVWTHTYGGKNLYGHEDNSPNHTGCL
jgi:hypothetical protein